MDGFSPTVDSAQRSHAPGTLVDKYGRRITYLRMSITDRCDFRCTYCMAEEMTFLPRHEVMSLEECLQVAAVFVGFGVSKLRITGGEPLVRKDALWLIERLGALPGLDNLVMTSNGSQLDRFAPALKAAGVRRINISLDTLRADRFRAITRIGDLAKVLAGIAAARAAGFARTKLNTVMMRGINDDEFADLVQFALDSELDISFIEEMPLGEILGRSNTYISSDRPNPRADPRATGGFPARKRGSASFRRTATISAIPATASASPPGASSTPASGRTTRCTCCPSCASIRTRKRRCARRSWTAWASSPGATTSRSRWRRRRSCASCR
jgi:molybdenum cofactor biosynthesis enzyme MoaA